MGITETQAFHSRKYLEEYSPHPFKKLSSFLTTIFQEGLAEYLNLVGIYLFYDQGFLCFYLAVAISPQPRRLMVVAYSRCICVVHLRVAQLMYSGR